MDYLWIIYGLSMDYDNIWINYMILYDINDIDITMLVGGLENSDIYSG